jgi:hypothetical protein
VAYSITNLGADLQAVLHGTTLAQITNLYGLYNRAAGKLLEDVDPQETKRTVETTGPIFTGVYDYPLPVDVKGNKIIDIRPQVNRSPQQVWVQSYNQAFDLTKILSNQNQFTMNFNTGLKSVRIATPLGLPAPVLINDAASIASNGTWTVGGGATNLSVDNQNYILDGGSLMFDLSAGPSTGYLENSTMDAVDLESALNQATQFLYTYLPSATEVTAVEFRFGSGSSDYYSLSTSVTQQNTVFQNGWNLLGYDWSSMTVTGSPDPSEIDYIRVTWTYDTTLQTGVRLNAITSNMGNILEMEYYSKYLFRNASSGAFQETVLLNSDLINLDTESYNLYFNLVAYYAVQQQQGANSGAFDGPFFLGEYKNGLQRYKDMYKAENQKPTQRYYPYSQATYTNYLGRRWGG